MKILSIDYSSVSTGYAIFNNGKYESSGLIILADYKYDRIREMIRQINIVINETKPDIVLAEDMVVFRNYRTSYVLTIILGGIIGTCTQLGIQYFLPAPSEWRNWVRNNNELIPQNREGLKRWGINKVRNLLSLISNDDECDAILIGYGYIKRYYDFDNNTIKYVDDDNDVNRRKI